MNDKKRFALLFSLGALLSSGTSGIEKNKQFYGVPQSIPSGMPMNHMQVNPSVNQRILNTNVAKPQEKSDIKGRIFYTLGGGTVGFVAGNVLQYGVQKEMVREKNNEICGLKEKLENLKNENCMMGSDLVHLTTKNSELENQISDLQEKFKEIEKKNESLNSKIKVLENDDKNEEIAKLQNEVKDLESKYKDVKAKSKEYEKSLWIARDLLGKFGNHSYLILEDLYSDLQNKEKVKFDSVAELALLNYFVRQAKKQASVALNGYGDDNIGHWTRNRKPILQKCDDHNCLGFEGFINMYSFDLNGSYSGELYEKAKNKPLKDVAKELIQNQLK